MPQGILHGRAHALANKVVEMVGRRQFVEKTVDRLVETNVDKLPSPVFSRARTAISAPYKPTK